MHDWRGNLFPALFLSRGYWEWVPTAHDGGWCIPAVLLRTTLQEGCEINRQQDGFLILPEILCVDQIPLVNDM